MNAPVNAGNVGTNTRAPATGTRSLNPQRPLRRTAMPALISQAGQIHSIAEAGA
jgi:hypothetical protein